MRVKKRNGSFQDLDINKIHSVLEWACNGDGDKLKPIKDVSLSQIEMKAHIGLHDKIKTKDIHESLIKAAAELISETSPNYDQVAARLRWFGVRKEAYNQFIPPTLREIIELNIKIGMYDDQILSFYSDDEWKIIDSFIDHTRDDLFRYAGAEQMYKKYVVQNRKTKQIYESFQIPYIMIALILFKNYDISIRLGYVKRYYDAVSNHLINLPTPIMGGLRTKVKQFSSCTVIDVADSLDSITTAATAVVDYASRKAGIGLNIGRIRAVGQVVRNGDAITTGVLPFAKLFAAALKSTAQGSIRGASGTFNWPIWHLEFETLIELKNNKGTEETRLRNVDYCVHLNRTMYERLVEGSYITFFSPDEVPDLYQAFYGPADKFKELYVKYEADRTKTKKQLLARDVFAKLLTERYDTGRIYIFHADHVNTNTPFYEKIWQTNLCVEIALPQEPILRDGTGTIALCTLSALNVGKLASFNEIVEVGEMAVRGLDELLDYQEYPNVYAKRHVDQYRPLGIGVIGFAHWLAKNGLRWGETSSEHVDKLFHDVSYSLIKASIQLAKEKGSTIRRTRYHDGIMPGNTPLFNDLAVDAKKYGIRNAVLMALMPSETSSTTSNETNGIEPAKALVTIKGSKDGVMSQVVPEIGRYGKRYQFAWDVSVKDYLTTVAVMQKYVDQSISANTSYNPHITDVTIGVLTQDLFMAYKLGIKTLYYNNTLDEAPESQDNSEECESCKL